MELRLRPYKACDAKNIVNWIKNEKALREWSSDRFGDFPITAENMNYKYLQCNGDCIEPDNFYPMTAFDDSGVVGHLIMRFTDPAMKTLRFGFVIVNDLKRGKGYGKQMLICALKFAFEIVKAEKVTLGVFENNISAINCYKAAGFKETGEELFCKMYGEKWKVIEMEIVEVENQ